MQHLTKSVALPCGLTGLKMRCISIHPGPTNTPILQQTLDKVGSDRAEMNPILSVAVALHRVAARGEIATAILFLASDGASYVTAT